MEVVKHRLSKPFNRKNMMDMAKILRNVTMPDKVRDDLVRAMANYFEMEDQFFDRKRFVDIAASRLSHDSRTEAYSKLKDL